MYKIYIITLIYSTEHEHDNRRSTSSGWRTNTEKKTWHFVDFSHINTNKDKQFLVVNNAAAFIHRRAS